MTIFTDMKTQLDNLVERVRMIGKLARLHNKFYSSSCRVDIVQSTETGQMLRVTPIGALSQGLMTRLSPGPYNRIDQVSSRSYLQGNEAVFALFMAQPMLAIQDIMSRASVQGDYMGEDNGSHYINISYA